MGNEFTWINSNGRSKSHLDNDISVEGLINSLKIAAQNFGIVIYQIIGDVDLCKQCKLGS